MNKKEYYTVIVEATAPITLKYRVFAESPEDAIRQLSNGQLIEPPQPNLLRMRKLAASVYRWGSSIIKLSKRF